MPDLTPEEVLALARNGTSPASTTPVTQNAGWTGLPTGPAQVGMVSWGDTDAAYWNLGDTAAGLLVRDREEVGSHVNARELERTGDASTSRSKPGRAVNDTTYGAILQRLGTMSAPERTALQKDLKAAGYLGKFKAGVPDDATVDAFATLLMETARASKSDEMLTWQDMLDRRIDAVESGASSESESHTYTSTSTTSKESGRGVIWEAFRDAVGRNPTESEVDKFMNRLNAKERANPTVTTQVNDAQGNQTSTTTGGFDSAAQADLVRQETQGNSEYAEYQAAAYYMPLMFQALGETTDLEGGL